MTRTNERIITLTDISQTQKTEIQALRKELADFDARMKKLIKEALASHDKIEREVKEGKITIKEEGD